VTGTKEWYSPKELFEMQQGLAKELEQTRTLIRQYNGLRERMTEMESAILGMAKVQSDCISRRTERYSMGKFIQEWGGWLMSAALGTKALGWW